jgi:hypothetical protein
MDKRFRIPVLFLALFGTLLAGCAVRGLATQVRSDMLFSNNSPATQSGGLSQGAGRSPLAGGKGAAPAATAAPALIDESTGPSAPSTGSGGASGGVPLIIKQGQIHLLVKDTDQAIDRLTQITSDSGGYIVSNRVWFEPFREENYKYASYTIAVPVDQFENALRRLRDLGIRVVDESASGQDVSEEYVDLQSRLNNLEATRDRIRGFLDQATTIDESLRINQQLSDIEDQIEKVKGRMNYLSSRAAFSTIAVQLDPQLPTIASPTPTPTPTPTPVPAGWDPGKTFEHASGLATQVAQFLVDAAIYLVVWVPFALPILIVWGIYKIATRKKNPA